MIQHPKTEKFESKKLPRLITASEVSHILGLGESTVYLLIQRGELPCVRIGRAVRVKQDDLDAFIESKVVKSSGY